MVAAPSLNSDLPPTLPSAQAVEVYRLSPATRLTRRLEELHRLAQEFVAEKDLAAARDSLIKERDTLQAKLAALQSEHSALAARHTSLAAAEKELAAARDSLIKERDNVVKERDNAAKERETLKETASDRAMRIAELEAQISDQAERQKQIDEEMAKAEGQLYMLKELLRTELS